MQRNQQSNLQYLLNRRESKEISKKKIYLFFINYSKAFDYVDHNKLWKALKEMGILDHLTLLLRNMYVGQEAAVRTIHGTFDWFKMRKEDNTGLSVVTLFV